VDPSTFRGTSYDKSQNSAPLTIRDSIRYQYEHSILSYEDEGSVWDGKRLEAGHRVSVMVRVSFSLLSLHNPRADLAGRTSTPRESVVILPQHVVYSRCIPFAIDT
jgi:hypothetical protein